MGIRGYHTSSRSYDLKNQYNKSLFSILDNIKVSTKENKENLDTKIIQENLENNSSKEHY